MDYFRRSRVPRQGSTAEYVGVEIECIVPSTGRVNASLNKSRVKGIKHVVALSRDSSISGEYGIEVKLLLRSSNYISIITEVCDILRKCGGRVNSSCGLHIHIGLNHLSTNRDKMALYRLLVDKLGEIKEAVHPSRYDNTYCKLNVNNKIDKGSRYRAINGQSISKHNTIEVRLHQGTISPHKIIAFIDLLKYLTIQDATELAKPRIIR